MLDLNKELKELESLSSTLKNTIDKIEKSTQKVQGKEKEFLMHNIGGIKDAVIGKGNINDVIENLNNYASSRP